MYMCVYEFKMLVPWKIELFLYENHITVTTCETLISLHKPAEINTNTEKMVTEIYLSLI